MTAAQRAAGLGFLATLAGAAAIAWALDVLPIRIPNPWVTMRSSRQRVFIDDDGRIEKGLPRRFRGIRLQDLTRVTRAVSKTKRRQRREERRLFPRSTTTFRNKDQAFKELLRANPQLRTFLDAHFGRDDERFLKWRANGRRGPKPTSGYSDGRLDAINYAWDLHGARSANNWTEAIYATIPDSRHWDDFGGRLEVLEEATGLQLELPDPAARLSTSRGDREKFQEGAELEVDEVYAEARELATMHTGGELEEAPF